MEELKEGYIFDYISGIQVKETPEEIEAVQPFSKILVDDYGYPKENIHTRPQYRVKVRPSDVKKEYPVDIAVFNSSTHSEDIERMTGHRRGDKIYKMLEFAGRDADVRDPWYSGNFRETYEDVVEGCQAFLDWLTINKKLSN